jgi:hypothetical protein
VGDGGIEPPRDWEIGTRIFRRARGSWGVLPETVRTGFVEKKSHQGFFLGKGKRREKWKRRQGDKATRRDRRV